MNAQRRLFLIDGPSLVYRAFYALPESIATSTGEPTNAIFGFASMLVKIVTEYGVCPTVVAWDAGTSGRTETYPEYKAQRRSRPDLLREQWPAFEPLVDAFGYGWADLQWFTRSVLAQALTNGYCAIPIVAGPCPHPNACLNCAHFRTDATFLEVHRAELHETERVIAKADANGWVRQSEMNARKRTSLINIVTTLEASHG